MGIQGSGVTGQERMADKRRGPCGQKAAKTCCVHGHELTPNNVRLTNGGRRRTCLTCEQIRQKSPHYALWRRSNQKKHRDKRRAARLATQEHAS